jgi:hypothetical protein
MKQKMNSIRRALLWIRPEQGDRKFFGSLMALVIAGFLIGIPKANAAQVNATGGTPLTPGLTTTINASTVFPLRITQNGTYTIQGSYSGDYGPPSGYSGAAITLAQAAERKAPTIGPTGMINAGSAHGIYVAPGLKDVTVILKNVGLQTTGQAVAAFIIDGYNGTSTTLAATYQNHSSGSNVVIQLPANTKSFLYSCRGQTSGNRAAIEVWKGSTVYIEGEGSLLAKSADSRNYSGNNGQPREPYAPHAQGSPYWTGIYATGNPPTGSSMWEVQANGGAAGIGSGNIGGSGGNVVIRGNPTVIAIAGAHGAGIGGGWNLSGTSPIAYHSDILIYGGTVESWGGMHGAGIGGGCYGGDGTIVVLPTASVYSASYDQARAMLGQMANVIYFGNPNDSRLALYTEDYREVEMFLDISKNASVRAVIERLGGGMNPSNLPLGRTRNDWPATGTNQHRPNYDDWAAGTSPVIEQGSNKYVLLLNGGFLPTNSPMAFLTAAKTEKNHSYNPVATTSNAVQYTCTMITAVTPLKTYGLNYPPSDTYYNAASPVANHYATSTAVSQAVPRFVMIEPRYEPSVTLTPTTPPNLYVGYPVTQTENKITLTIGNLGNQKLYHPTITIIGDDYELIGTPGTLQDAVNTALAGMVTTDAGGPHIPVGVVPFTLDLRLKAGKSPGTSYEGWVIFSADDLPDAATPKMFKINVIDKILPPPDLFMETPTDPVVSGPYKLRAQFKNPATNTYPYYVKDLLDTQIFVDYGEVISVTEDPLTEDSPGSGFYSDWIIDITPAPGLPNQTTISASVKQNSAEDPIGAHTQTVSQPLPVTLNSEGPYVTFSVSDNQILPALNTLLIYFNGSGITPTKEDSVYIDPGAIGQFTETGAEADLQSTLTLTQLPSTSLNLNTPYTLSVTDENRLEIGSPAPDGFPNGDYELTIPANYIRNYNGNFLPATTLHFSIHKPEIQDGAGVGGVIDPPSLEALGGTTRIWVYGIHLLAAKGLLSIVFRDGNRIPGYSLDQEVYVPLSQFTDATAYIDVVLPPNLTITPETYRFTIRLFGRTPGTDVTPNLTATVGTVGARIDTTATSLGYREGLNAWPHEQSYLGGPVDLKLVGQNLFFLNTAPNSNLHVRVLKNGVQVATIPVSTPATIGPIVIPPGNYSTEMNLTYDDDVYVFQLWHDNGTTLVAVSESSTSLPYVSDSTTVASGLKELERILRNTHHVVQQSVANTPSTVAKWLVPQLNAIAILHDFGLTIEEDDISFTGFDEAVAGTTTRPQGQDGSFVFSLRLRLTPELSIPLNTGEIIAEGASPAVIHREILMPEVAGYVTDPPPGDHHLESGRDFTFYLIPTEEDTRMYIPKVTTNRRIGSDIDGVIVDPQEDGYYLVTIREIRESIEIYITNGTPPEDDANADIAGTTVWGEKGVLYVRSLEPGIARIYSATGSLSATITAEAGVPRSTPLPAGVYIVSLNGVTYKTIVK